MANLWMVRSQKGLLYDKFIEKGVILLGWSEVGPLNKFATRDEIFQQLCAVFPDRREQTNSVHSGLLYRFANDFEVGDRVLTYHPGRRVYYLGEITGDYEFNKSVDETYPSFRNVNWFREIDRDHFSVKAKYQLGSTITIFKIGDDALTEIDNLVMGNEAAAIVASVDRMSPVFEEIDEEIEEDFYETSLETIKDKINGLDWEELQELIAGLLRSLGYKTRVSDKGPDRGKDITASPDGFGFTSPRIVVEVKHRKGAMGAPEIRSFLGGRHAEDRGLYVSTGGFTKEALYEAERANIPVDLMDIDRLAEEVIDQYEDFDIQTKQLLPLKRLYWPA